MILSETSELVDGNSIYCNKTQLLLPKNALRWVCDLSFEDKVAKNGKCFLECNQFFEPIYGKKIDHFAIIDINNIETIKYLTWA